MSIVGKAGEYGHNNPDFAFVDSNFIRGGGRIVANLTALYALAANADQLKQHVTIVHVTDIGDGTSRKYELVNITDITSGVFNPTAWAEVVAVPQPLGTTDSPAFSGLTVNGNVGVTGTIHPSHLTLPVSHAITWFDDGGSDYMEISIPSLGSNKTLLLPAGGTVATTSDVAAAVAAGNLFVGKFVSLAALQAAFPTGIDGNYAFVYGSVSDQEYIWDSDHASWVLTTIVPAGTFAALGGAPSDNAALASALAAKVDVVSGYGLISDSDQTKLNGIATGATANSVAAQSDVATGTDNVKFLTSALWTWIKTQAATISGLWNFTGGLQSAGNDVETQNNKDANSGYAGLTLFKINFKNVLNTFTSYFTNNNTASRTYTFKDRNGTILDDTDAATFVDISSNQAAIGGNKTFTRDVTISAVSPTLKFITSGDDGLSFVNRTTVLNSLTLNNNVNSVGGSGNGIRQSSSAQYVAGSDAGLGSGTSINQTVSLWFKSSTFQTDSILFEYGTFNSNALVITLQGPQQVIIKSGFSDVFNVTIPVITHYNGLQHNIIVAISGSTAVCYYDGHAYVMTSLGSYNVALSGLADSGHVFGSIQGVIDQLLVYNRAINSTEAGQIYNGGSGTLNLPISGLIRRYEFEEGSGITTADTNPNGTQYPLTLTGGATWAGVGNGIIPVAGSLQLNQKFIEYVDGINVGEYGQAKFGNILSGTFVQGNSVYHYINGNYPLIQGNDGCVLISKSNNSQSSRGLSALSVVDGVAIGTYAQMNTAPSNGLIVSGSVGIGTNSVLSKLNVAGSLSIGSTYASTIAAPTDGLIVQGMSTLTGNTAIGGTASTANSLLIGTSSTSISSNGIGRALYFNGVLQATADNDNLYAADFTQGTQNVSIGATSINTFTITNGGVGYVNGTYNTVPLTGGSGTGAIATIVVTGGIVTTANVINATGPGNTSVGYAIGNALSASNSNLGGSGSGLVLTVASVTYRQVTRYDIRANNMVPSASGAGNIGSSTLPYNIVVSNNITTGGVRMLNTSFVLTDQGSSPCLSVFGTTGNLILYRNFTQTETNYKLTVHTGILGSILTTDTVTAASNIARGVYLNNTLTAIANSDTLVALDVAPTFSTGPNAIQTLGSITAGSGYTNAIYSGLSLTGGTGTGATANITVSGNVVTAVTVVARGTGYIIGDTLSATIPGGSGFSISVATIGLTSVSTLALRTTGNSQLNGSLEVSGTSLAASGICAGIKYTGTLRAVTTGDIMAKMDLTGGSFDTSTNGSTIGNGNISITTGGSGYVTGTYNLVPLTGGSGTGAIAQVTVNGSGVVTGVFIQGSGSGYATGNVLSASNTNLGGSGSGLTCTLVMANLLVASTKQCDLRVNNLLPSVAGGGSMGTPTLPYASFVATTIQANAWQTLTDAAVTIVNAGRGAYAWWNFTGNMLLTLGETQTDNGYRLEAAGAGKFRGAGNRLLGVIRGFFLQHTLTATTNNDVQVALDIDCTMSCIANPILTYDTLDPGSGYSNGTNTVALTGGTGTGATATIVRAGGVVTSVTIVSQGSGYTVGDILSSSLIGVGTGFNIRVASLGLSGVVGYDIRTKNDVLVGGKLNVNTGGTNPTAGIATLVSGTITINNTLVTANSLIMLSYRNPSGTTGTHLAQGIIVAGTSFVVNSLDTSSAIVTGDNNTFNWWLIN